MTARTGDNLHVSPFRHCKGTETRVKAEIMQAVPGFQEGVTLMEMLVVVSLVGLLAAISYPAVSSGIDSLRLTSASESIASFLNAALNRAERRQQVMEISISKAERALWLRSSEPGYVRKLELPDGVAIARVLPEVPEEGDQPRRILLHPAGAIPRFGVELVNRKGARRIVRVDPITGVPRVVRLEEKP